MAELVFEKGTMALEATAGTAVGTPTHIMPGNFVLTPDGDVFRPSENRGTRAEYYRGKTTKRHSTWETGDTGLDTAMLPPLLNLAVAGVTTPTTPAGATLARLWTFARSQTSVTEKTATFTWGDANVQIFQAAYGVCDSFSITSDGTGSDGCMMNFSGRAKAMSKIADPTYPPQLIGPLVVPLESQLWIDTGSDAIGTTAITGRVLSSAFSIDNLRGEAKYVWVGPGGSIEPNRYGVNKTHAQLVLRFELDDMDQYDLLMDPDIDLWKVRVRLNGPEIEDGFNHYVEIDFYGFPDIPAWGEYASSNRTIDVTLQSQYFATAGHDWQIKVQNNRTAL